MAARAVEQAGTRPHRQAPRRYALPAQTHRAILLAPVVSTVKRGIGRDLAVEPDTARPLARPPIYAEITPSKQPPPGSRQDRVRPYAK
jgi:hypothetical protein